LYYQIGLIGKRDLALAPDPRTGFEMVLLRMIAFRPGAGDNGRTTARPETRSLKTLPQDGGRSDSAGAEVTDLVDWWGLVEKIPVNGVVRELAMNLGLSDVSKDVFYLILDPSHEYLYDSARIELINAEIRNLGVNVLIKVEIKKHDIQTPALRMLRLREEKLQTAEQAITDDPTVQALQEKFGATLVKESIRLRE
jgi:DNA polymerase-3 subunit gamma/tau